jgi:hypothetical protein
LEILDHIMMTKGDYQDILDNLTLNEKIDLIFVIIQKLLNSLKEKEEQFFTFFFL